MLVLFMVANSWFHVSLVCFGGTLIWFAIERVDDDLNVFAIDNVP